MSKDDTIRPDSEQIIKSGIDDETVRVSSQIISAGLQTSSATPSIANQIILNNEKYIVLKSIGVSGEAEVFLLEKNNEKFVLKLYYPRFSPKTEIVQSLKGLKHPDIIALIDYGYYENRFFEVMEYAEGGSLYDLLPVRDIKFLTQMVREAIEALNYCHTHSIIHRDIKPQNLFLKNADKRDLLIGDFGISSTLDEGFSKRLTSQSRTTIYAAPELFQSIGGKTVIDKKVDYYSLGITLIYLWTGKEPFEGLGEYGIMRMKIEGRVEIPDDLPEEFKNLIKGLITVEPPKRWGYEEVQSWLKGERVAVHYRTYKPEYKEFVFGMIKGEQMVVSDPADLAELMDKYPDIGTKHLYKKGISKWVEQVNQSLFSEIESIVDDEYPRDQTAGLIKAIYILDTDRRFKGVDGEFYFTNEEIAECFERNFSHYEKDLQNPNAPYYLFLEARGYQEEANRFRKLFKTVSSGKASLNTLILILQGGDTFIMGEYRITKPEELLSVDKDTKLKLINDLADIESKLSIWIQAFPDIKDNIDKWRFLKRFDETTFRYALKEGFEFQGKIARDVAQLKDLLKGYLSTYTRGTKNFDWKEAEYWLTNYINASFDDFIKTYHSLVNELIETSPETPYKIRYEKEISVIKTQTQLIKDKILKERNDKKRVVDEEYNKILSARREDYKKERKEKSLVAILDRSDEGDWYYRWLIIISAVIGAVTLAINLINFVINEAFNSGLGVIGAIFFGVIVGAGLGAIVGIVGAVLGAIVELVLGKFAMVIMGPIRAIIYVIIAIISGIVSIALYPIYKYKINAIQLTPQEESAYKDSLDNIEKHFAGKEKYGMTQASINIIGSFDF
ncbi:MAG: protein kinase [bacterium]